VSASSETTPRYEKLKQRTDKCERRIVIEGQERETERCLRKPQIGYPSSVARQFPFAGLSPFLISAPRLDEVTAEDGGITEDPNVEELGRTRDDTIAILKGMTRSI
jgi:hypothetical protein